MLRAYVDFSRILRPWDGFGVTYRTFASAPARFNPEFVFGSDGLRASIVRIFLDPWHQKKTDTRYPEDGPGEADEYDHTTGTEQIREFCTSAQSQLQKRGQSLKVITTCLAPPEWMTKQKVISGRDLDPLHRAEYARYMISWLKFLEKQMIPVKYLSLHCKGERWDLWDEQGRNLSRDLHNLYWPPEHVTDFLKLLKKMLQKSSLQTGLAPGETESIINFQDWGYVDAIIDDPQALGALDLISSYGSFSGEDALDCRSSAIDLIHQQRPDTPEWIVLEHSDVADTSFSSLIHNYIYGAKINAALLDSIPVETERSANVASVDFLKPLFWAGQPGMVICQVACNCKGISITGFSGNLSGNPDSFVLVNSSDKDREIPVEIRGSASSKFALYRTSPQEKFVSVGIIPVREGKVESLAPAHSVSAFFGSV